MVQKTFKTINLKECRDEEYARKRQKPKDRYNNFNSAIQDTKRASIKRKMNANPAEDVFSRLYNSRKPISTRRVGAKQERMVQETPSKVLVGDSQAGRMSRRKDTKRPPTSKMSYKNMRSPEQRRGEGIDQVMRTAADKAHRLLVEVPTAETTSNSNLMDCSHTCIMMRMVNKRTAVT